MNVVSQELDWKKQTLTKMVACGNYVTVLIIIVWTLRAIAKVDICMYGSTCATPRV